MSFGMHARNVIAGQGRYVPNKEGSPMKFKTLVLDQRSADTVLAALRLYASLLNADDIPDEILGIACDSADPLDANEINAICIQLGTPDTV